jgi:hypothetical protein
LKRFVLLPVLFLFAGCAGFVPIDEAPRGVAAAPADIPGPDPGAGVPIRTMNFLVEGYGTTPQANTTLVEKIYSEVTTQTALSTFRPKENYRVVIYKDAQEFRTKTGQPEWSGGMKYKNGVYTYEQNGIETVLSHEITHVIFGDFMGRATANYRWLNEGLAMAIEARFTPGQTWEGQLASWASQVRGKPLMPLAQILSFQPYSEETKSVEVWYATSASLVGYLIDNGGAFNFSVFLSTLRGGGTLDQAFQTAYPGKYKSADELYSLWRATVGL